MKIVSIFFVVLLIGIIAIVVFAKLTVKPASQDLLKTPLARSSAFSIQNPPLESLKGDIASFSGDIKWESRTATMPGELKTQTIKQGEELDTGDNGKILVDFPTVGTFSLLPNTTLGFVQTLPAGFSLSQEIGTVEYSNITQPIGIRSLSSLIKIESGDVTVKVDPDNQLVTTSVKSGSATVGFNDSTNTSNVIQITSGNSYMFHDDTKTGDIEQL